MITNAFVRLFHFDEDTQEETEVFSGRASLFGNTKIGDLSHGRRKENGYTLRIPTKADILVSCGDKVFCDKFPQTLTVVGFSDNRRGSRFSHHYKLILK